MNVTVSVFGTPLSLFILIFFLSPFSYSSFINQKSTTSYLGTALSWIYFLPHFPNRRPFIRLAPVSQQAELFVNFAIMKIQRQKHCRRVDTLLLIQERMNKWTVDYFADMKAALKRASDYLNRINIV